MQPYTNVTQRPRLLRIRQVLEIIPVSKSTWWQGVKDGRFPAPIKLGPRTTCWREPDVLALTEHPSEKGVRHA
jgi:prophage regulatory protein